MGDEKRKYYRKNVELFLLLEKVKLWPSKKGILHGVKDVQLLGKHVLITTHCGKQFRVYNSRSSRAARWLRNKWVSKPCPDCKIPEWKLEKYSKTFFDTYGSDLRGSNEN
jgi:pyrrolysyl-tRNA synthetase-like protein